MTFLKVILIVFCSLWSLVLIISIVEDRIYSRKHTESSGLVITIPRGAYADETNDTNLMYYCEYTAKIVYSASLKCFCGVIENIPEYKVFFGDSVEELRVNFKNSVERYEANKAVYE